MQRYNTGHDPGERCRNLRVASIRHAFFVVHNEAVNLGVECVPHLRHIAREFDHRAAGSDLNVREALRGQPLRDGLDICVRRTKLFAELVRGQPRVIIRRGFALLIIEKFPQCGFLIRTSLKK